MKQTKHTPGPWRLTWDDFDKGGSRFNIDFERDGATGNVVLGDGMRGPTGRANARLIAEAPAMAALLRKAQSFLTTDVVESEDVHAEIDALLARIDGGDPFAEVKDYIRRNPDANDPV